MGRKGPCQSLRDYLLLLIILMRGQKLTKSAGFGIIEIIVAMSIMIIIAATGTSTVLHSFSSNRLGGEETQATLFAQEGVEAVRSIKNQDWTNLSTGTYGLDDSGGTWALSGSSETEGKFTRQIVISQVQRDSNGDIVDSGGTVDSDTLKATSQVDWEFSPTRNNTVTLVTYLSNFEKPISSSNFGNWSQPQLITSLDISGSSNAVKIQVQGDYAYLVREGGDPDFVSIDISNPASPFIADSFDINGSPENIAVSGNYAYVVSTSDEQEFRIIDISDPTNMSLLGFYNASGSANGMGVYVVGSTAYLVRETSSSHEFIIINVTNPASPTLIGSTNLSDSGKEVVVMGNYAYVGTYSDSRELEIVDISNPASPSVVSWFNASGSANSQSIDITGSTIVLGRNSGHIHIIDVSNPLSPSEIDYYDADDDVEDVDVYQGDTLTYAFFATDEGSAEFVLLDITNPSSTTLVSTLNLANQGNGIAYHEGFDRAFVASEADNAELMVIGPQ